MFKFNLLSFQILSKICKFFYYLEINFLGAFITVWFPLSVLNPSGISLSKPLMTQLVLSLVKFGTLSQLSMDAEICRKSWREKISLRFKGCYGAAFFIRFHPFHCSTEVEISCICRCSGLLKFPQTFFRIHRILESARFLWRLYHNHGPESFSSGVWLAQPI